MWETPSYRLLGRNRLIVVSRAYKALRGFVRYRLRMSAQRWRLGRPSIVR